MSALAIIQGAHLARCILNALCSRPISVSNSPFVSSCLRSLHSIASALENSSGTPPEYCDAETILSRRLYEAVKKPRIERLRAFKSFLENEFPLYGPIMRARYEFEHLDPLPFWRKSFSELLIFVGPGIGIGDEMQFVDFFRAIRSYFGIATGNTDVYSYAPGLWEALEPEIQVHDAASAPMDFFIRATKSLNKDLPPLIIFGSFMSQEMLRCFMPYWRYLPSMEVALASGQVWLHGHPSGVGFSYQTNPEPKMNFKRSLELLQKHLFGEIDARSERTFAKLPDVSAGKPFRLLVHPFTSKTSHWEPEDWARWIAEIRNSLRISVPLEIRILPGLTPWCQEFAGRLISACKSLEATGSRCTLLETTASAGHPTNNLIGEVHAAIQESDLFLTIDTYTAHLAAKSRTPTFVLCLNWNVEFWEPAPHTFWANVGGGDTEALALLRTIVRLIVRDLPGSGRAVEFGLASRTLCTLGDPLQFSPVFGATSQSKLETWCQHADAVWTSLPGFLRQALDTLDASQSWSHLGSELRQATAQSAHRLLGKLADSNFYRLAVLGAVSLHPNQT